MDRRLNLIIDIQLAPLSGKQIADALSKDIQNLKVPLGLDTGKFDGRLIGDQIGQQILKSLQQFKLPSAGGGFLGGLAKSITAPFQAIFTGAFENIGRSITQDLGDGIASGLKRELAPIIGSFELLGREAAAGFVREVRKELAGPLLSAIEQTVKEVVGEKNLYREAGAVLERERQAQMARTQQSVTYYGQAAKKIDTKALQAADLQLRKDFEALAKTRQQLADDIRKEAQKQGVQVIERQRESALQQAQVASTGAAAPEQGIAAAQTRIAQIAQQGQQRAEAIRNQIQGKLAEIEKANTEITRLQAAVEDAAVWGDEAEVQRLKQAAVNADKTRKERLKEIRQLQRQEKELQAIAKVDDTEVKALQKQIEGFNRYLDAGYEAIATSMAQEATALKQLADAATTEPERMRLLKEAAQAEKRAEQAQRAIAAQTTAGYAQSSRLAEQGGRYGEVIQQIEQSVQQQPQFEQRRVAAEDTERELFQRQQQIEAQKSVLAAGRVLGKPVVTGAEPATIKQIQQTIENNRQLRQEQLQAIARAQGKQQKAEAQQLLQALEVQGERYESQLDAFLAQVSNPQRQVAIATQVVEGIPDFLTEYTRRSEVAAKAIDKLQHQLAARNRAIDRGKKSLESARAAGNESEVARLETVIARDTAKATALQAELKKATDYKFAPIRDIEAIVQVISDPEADAALAKGVGEILKQKQERIDTLNDGIQQAKALAQKYTQQAKLILTQGGSEVEAKAALETKKQLIEQGKQAEQSVKALQADIKLLTTTFNQPAPKPQPKPQPKREQTIEDRRKLVSEIIDLRKQEAELDQQIKDQLRNYQGESKSPQELAPVRDRLSKVTELRRKSEQALGIDPDKIMSSTQRSRVYSEAAGIPANTLPEAQHKASLVDYNEILDFVFEEVAKASGVDLTPEVKRAIKPKVSAFASELWAGSENIDENTYAINQKNIDAIYEMVTNPKAKYARGSVDVLAHESRHALQDELQRQGIPLESIENLPRKRRAAYQQSVADSMTGYQGPRQLEEVERLEADAYIFADSVLKDLQKKVKKFIEQRGEELYKQEVAQRTQPEVPPQTAQATYQDVFELVAQASGVKGGQIPQLVGDAELKGRASYRRATNQIAVSPQDLERLATGEIGDDLLKFLVHELRHAMQQQGTDLLTGTQPELQQYGELIEKSVSAYRGTELTGERVRELETDAYVFADRVMRALAEGIEDIPRYVKEAGQKVEGQKAEGQKAEGTTATEQVQKLRADSPPGELAVRESTAIQRAGKVVDTAGAIIYKTAEKLEELVFDLVPLGRTVGPVAKKGIQDTTKYVVAPAAAMAAISQAGPVGGALMEGASSLAGLGVEPVMHAAEAELVGTFTHLINTLLPELLRGGTVNLPGWMGGAGLAGPDLAGPMIAEFTAKISGATNAIAELTETILGAIVGGNIALAGGKRALQAGAQRVLPPELQLPMALPGSRQAEPEYAPGTEQISTNIAQAIFQRVGKAVERVKEERSTIDVKARVVPDEDFPVGQTALVKANQDVETLRPLIRQGNVQAGLALTEEIKFRFQSARSQIDKLAKAGETESANVLAEQFVKSAQAAYQELTQALGTLKEQGVKTEFGDELSQAIGQTKSLLNRQAQAVRKNVLGRAKQSEELFAQEAETLNQVGQAIEQARSDIQEELFAFGEIGDDLEQFSSRQPAGKAQQSAIDRRLQELDEEIELAHAQLTDDLLNEQNQAVAEQIHTAAQQVKQPKLTPEQQARYQTLETETELGNEDISNLPPRSQRSYAQFQATAARQEMRSERIASGQYTAVDRAKEVISQEGVRTIQAAGKAVESFKADLPSLEEAMRSAGGAATFLKRSFDFLLENVKGLGLAVAGVAIFSQVAPAVFDFGRAAFEASARIESLQTSMNFLFGSADAGAKQMEFVRSEVDRLSLPLEGSARGFQQLAAAAQGTQLEGEKTEEIFSALSQAGRVYALSQEDINGVLLASGQIISKGTVQAEELRGQIGERLPGAFNKFATAIGVSTEELSKQLQRGEVGLDDFYKFTQKLAADTAGGVDAASQTSQAAMARFATAFEQLQVSFGKTIQPIVVPALNAIGAAMKFLGDNSNVVAAAIKAIALVMGGALVVNLVLAVPALGAVAAGIGSITLASLAFIATPIGAAIAALTLALLAAEPAGRALGDAISGVNRAVAEASIAFNDDYGKALNKLQRGIPLTEGELQKLKEGFVANAEAGELSWHAAEILAKNLTTLQQRALEAEAITNRLTAEINASDKAFEKASNTLQTRYLQQLADLAEAQTSGLINADQGREQELAAEQAQSQQLVAIYEKRAADQQAILNDFARLRSLGTIISAEQLDQEKKAQEELLKAQQDGLKERTAIAKRELEISNNTVLQAEKDRQAAIQTLVNRGVYDEQLANVQKLESTRQRIVAQMQLQGKTADLTNEYLQNEREQQQALTTLIQTEIQKRTDAIKRGYEQQGQAIEQVQQQEQHRLDLLDLQNKALENQGKLLTAQQNLSKARTDLAAGEFDIQRAALEAQKAALDAQQKEGETNLGLQVQSKALQQQIEDLAIASAQAKRESLIEEQKFARENLALQQQQTNLALQREQSANRLAQLENKAALAQNLADIAQAQADVEKIKQDKTLTPAERQSQLAAAQLQVSAKVTGRAALEQKGGILGLQGEQLQQQESLNTRIQGMERQTLELQQVGELRRSLADVAQAFLQSTTGKSQGQNILQGLIRNPQFTGLPQPPPTFVTGESLLNRQLLQQMQPPNLVGNPQSIPVPTTGKLTLDQPQLIARIDQLITLERTLSTQLLGIANRPQVVQTNITPPANSNNAAASLLRRAGR